MLFLFLPLTYIDRYRKLSHKFWSLLASCLYILRTVYAVLHFTQRVSLGNIFKVHDFHGNVSIIVTNGFFCTFSNS